MGVSDSNPSYARSSRPHAFTPTRPHAHPTPTPARPRPHTCSVIHVRSALLSAAVRASASSARRRCVSRSASSAERTSRSRSSTSRSCQALEASGEG